MLLGEAEDGRDAPCQLPGPDLLAQQPSQLFIERDGRLVIKHMITLTACDHTGLPGLIRVHTCILFI